MWCACSRPSSIHRSKDGNDGEMLDSMGILCGKTHAELPPRSLLGDRTDRDFVWLRAIESARHKGPHFRAPIDPHTGVQLSRYRIGGGLDESPAVEAPHRPESSVVIMLQPLQHGLPGRRERKCNWIPH